MVSLEEIKKSVGEDAKKYSDEDLIKIRDDLDQLANIVFDKWLEEIKNKHFEHKADEKYFHKSSERRSIYHATIRWNGYVNIYFFKYGERYYDPFNKTNRFLLEEDYTVYFDPNNLAKKMTRTIVRQAGRSEGIEIQEIDLKKKFVKR